MKDSETTCNIEQLPPEVLTMIFKNFTEEEYDVDSGAFTQHLRRARLSSKKLERAAAPFLFNRVTISSLQQDIDATKNIIQHPRLKHFVRTISWSEPKPLQYFLSHMILPKKEEERRYDDPDFTRAMRSAYQQKLVEGYRNIDNGEAVTLLKQCLLVCSQLRKIRTTDYASSYLQSDDRAPFDPVCHGKGTGFNGLLMDLMWRHGSKWAMGYPCGELRNFHMITSALNEVPNKVHTFENCDTSATWMMDMLGPDSNERLSTFSSNMHHLRLTLKLEERETKSSQDSEYFAVRYGKLADVLKAMTGLQTLELGLSSEVPDPAKCLISDLL